MLYPEQNRTMQEIIDAVNTATDNTCIVTLSETVLKQLHKMFRSGKLDKNKLIIESNLPEYTRFNKTAEEFLYKFYTLSNHSFR